MLKQTMILTACSLLSLKAATVYAIDLNDADAPLTATGWTGLDATHTGNGGSVIVGGVNFSVGSSDGSRLRGTVPAPNPDALIGDFIFDDGAGQAVILFFGGAGDLPAGDWKVEVWIHDSGVALGNMEVGLRDDASTASSTFGVAPSTTGPAHTFTFTSDGTSAYDVFVREDNGGNQSRLNALRLTSVPEPSSSMLALLALPALLRRRR